MNQRQLGTAYEKRVATFMRDQGYEILEQSFRCRLGEIDLIARKDAYLVFVEVKYRSSAAYGSPMAAVDRRKQRRVCNVASYYLYSRHYPIDTPCRFDVAAVSGDSIQIFEDAFSYCGNFGR